MSTSYFNILRRRNMSVVSAAILGMTVPLAVWWFYRELWYGVVGRPSYGRRVAGGPSICEGHKPEWVVDTKLEPLKLSVFRQYAPPRRRKCVCGAMVPAMEEVTRSICAVCSREETKGSGESMYFTAVYPCNNCMTVGYEDSVGALTLLD